MKRRLLVVVCLILTTTLLWGAGCGGGGTPGSDPGKGGAYVSASGVSALAVDPALLKVIDFTPAPIDSHTGPPFAMLGLWGTTIQNLAWSTHSWNNINFSSASLPLAYVDFTTNNLYATYALKNGDRPSPTVCLTPGSPNLERLPAWNNNATYLSYTANNHLYKVKANGSALVQLTNRPNLDNGRQEWSPDGTKIAFSDSDASGNPMDIWVMNADGSVLTNLTGGGKNQHPTWTSDGRQIVWSKDSGSGFHLWEMLANGTYKRQITNFSGQQEIQPCVAFRDAWIAYTQVIGANMQIAYTYDWGQTQQLVTSSGVNQWPAVSPQNDCIAYQSNLAGSQDIWVVDSEGQGPIDLTPVSGNHGMPTWKTRGYYHVALGPVGTDAGFNPTLGTSAAATLATVGTALSPDPYDAFFTSYSVNDTGTGAVTLTKVDSHSTEGLIDVMASTSLRIRENLFRGVAPRDILGGTNPIIPGAIQRAILFFNAGSGLCTGALSFGGTVTPVQLLVPAARPYTVTQSGGATVISGDLGGLWTATGGYHNAVSQVTIDASGRITAR